MPRRTCRRRSRSRSPLPDVHAIHHIPDAHFKETDTILKLEDHCDIANATIDDVVWAVYEIARPDGPTYLVVEDGQDTYAQAAGTDGRADPKSQKTAVRPGGLEPPTLGLES
jgi:hypothetical protein